MRGIAAAAIIPTSAQLGHSRLLLVSPETNSADELASRSQQRLVAPLPTAAAFHQVTEAFDEPGNPVNPVTEVSQSVALHDLEWWSDPLEAVRAKGQLPPAVLRIRTAAAADEVEEEAV